MTAKIIDFKPHLRKKIEDQLEKEADILFEGEVSWKVRNLYHT